MENKTTVNFKPIYATTQTISQHLKNLGIPASVLGYTYLKHGIYAALNDETLIHSITKRLYPLIAEECCTTPSRVERAIRHSIELAFNVRYFDDERIKLLEEFFGSSIKCTSGKPTNSEFIASIAEKIRMDALVAAESEAIKLGHM